MTLRRAGGSVAAFRFGPVFQLGFVVPDLEAAVDYWTGTIGAGPFFLFSDVVTANVSYRGSPAGAAISVAFGHWHDMQIELLTVHDARPNIYREWLDAGHAGINHYGVIVPDRERARADCHAAGLPIVYEAETPSASRILYVDTGGGPGSMIELVELDPAMGPAFDHIRAAARDWDGGDPLRAMPPQDQ
ncbi:MAG: VOC family protein [Sphingobium sp.]|nr:VOC family protein [Sphingobium sp.]